MTQRIAYLNTVVNHILTPYSPAPGAADRICTAYSEHWRMYHGIDHPLGMWHGAKALGLSTERLSEIGLLIIFHDVWIKIGRAPGESERESAKWAWRDLSHYAQNPRWLLALVHQGIEATIYHNLENVDKEFAETVGLLLDLDLWGLGQSPENFQNDTEKIWHEYEPMFTRAEFDAGRSKWAETFLERPFIYHDPRFKHLEEQARANLKALAG